MYPSDESKKTIKYNTINRAAMLIILPVLQQYGKYLEGNLKGYKAGDCTQ